jgi:HEAT repeat protein
MGTHKKVIDQIKIDLLSEDEGIIKKALVKTRDKGNELLIDTLIKLYTSSKNEMIKEEVKSIFSEIKNKNSIDYLLPYLENESNEIKELALYALWSSGLDMTDHIPKVVGAACSGNFMVILEALTVLENLEGPFPEEDLLESNTLLQEQLHESNDSSSKDLLKSMYEVIQQFENQIDVL